MRGPAGRAFFISSVLIVNQNAGFNPELALSRGGAQNAGFSPELTVCWVRLRRKFWQGVRGVSKGAASHFGVLFGYFLAQARKYARGARRNAPVILKRQNRLIPVHAVEYAKPPSPPTGEK